MISDAIKLNFSEDDNLIEINLIVLLGELKKDLV